MKILILIGLLSIPSYACEKGTDCSFGSRCMKPKGEYLGHCIGGMRPGKLYDLNPAFNLEKPKEGNTCENLGECGKLKCVTYDSAIGVCL